MADRTTFICWRAERIWARLIAIPLAFRRDIDTRWLWNPCWNRSPKSGLGWLKMDPCQGPCSAYVVQLSVPPSTRSLCQTYSGKIIKNERHCFVTGRVFSFCVLTVWDLTEPELYQIKVQNNERLIVSRSEPIRADRTISTRLCQCQPAARNNAPKQHTHGLDALRASGKCVIIRETK